MSQQTEASRTLRAAVAHIKTSHKPGCADEEFWRKIAGWLGCVAIDEEYGEPETAPRLRELSTALDIARILLGVSA